MVEELLQLRCSGFSHCIYSLKECQKQTVQAISCSNSKKS